MPEGASRPVRHRSTQCFEGASGPVKHDSGSSIDNKFNLDLAEKLTAPRRAPVMKNPLRQTAVNIKDQENNMAIGGMRRPQVSVTKVPSLVKAGAKLRKILEDALDQHPHMQDQCMAGIGSESPNPGPNDQDLDHVRQIVADWLKVDDIGPVDTGEITTELRGELLRGWQIMSEDPDNAVCDWLTNTGVPAGISVQPQDCGIFPHHDGEPGQDSAIPECDPSLFQTYQSVEADDFAAEEIQRYVERRWLREFDTLEDTIAFLGEAPVMSKFGMITRMRAGKLKKRIILDSASSGVSDYATKPERLILPRLLDVAMDVLVLMSDGDEVELTVLDFADAFWLLPLAPEERRWFVSKFRGKYYVFMRAAQGSRNAPLAWGRLAAFMGRLTQSLFDKTEVRLQIYTDDPCAAVAGSLQQRNRRICIIILCWRVFGFPLSWRKGSRGAKVSWIGGDFAITQQPAAVSVRIKDDLFQDSRELVNKFLDSNVISYKELRSGVGKLCHIANLLTPWRPFMSPLYGALYSDPPAGAPRNCLWTKQLRRPLSWFKTFFDSSGGLIERTFLVDSFTQKLQVMQIVVDASPWGLAAVLLVNGHPTNYFADAISDLDVALFQCPIGSPKGQQVWESLAALVAVRLWRPLWGQHAVQLLVKGDSVTMLTLMVNMRPTTPALCVIGQELALDFAEVPFVPTIVEHIPGVANTIADRLSRIPQPGASQIIPAILHNAEHNKPPIRCKTYYRTLSKVL